MIVRIIQSFSRKINTFLTERLSLIDYIAIIGLILAFAGLFATLTVLELSERKELVYRESTASAQISSTPNGELASKIIGSKGGQVYYYSWCKGVSRIKKENMVTFTSDEEAKIAGRKLASTCK
jgi:hypothetical protein